MPDAVTHKISRSTRYAVDIEIPKAPPTSSDDIVEFRIGSTEWVLPMWAWQQFAACVRAANDTIVSD